MANTIKIKRGEAASAPSALARGEFGFSEGTAGAALNLHIGWGAETNGAAANITRIGSNFGITDTDAVQIDGADIATGEFAKFTANGLQSRTTAETLSDIGGDAAGTARPCNGTGTQISTDVSLAGTPDYITLDTQTLTLGQINLETDVTGSLPDSNIASEQTWNSKHTPGEALAMGANKITGLADPTNGTDAANKQYVDAHAQGLDTKLSVVAVETSEIDSPVYAQPETTSGLGATLTAPSNAAFPTVDGVTLAVGERVLIAGQGGAGASHAHNGIYTLTTLGSGSVKWVLTRATDFDTNDEVTSAAFTFVEEGTVNADSGWVVPTNDPLTFANDTFSGVAFTQFSGAGQITAGAGLNKSVNALSVNVKADAGVIITSDELELDLGASTINGSLADGDIASASTWNGKQDALTFGIANTNAVKINDTDAADNDYAKFTASGLEGRAYSEVLSDIGAAASAHAHGVSEGGTGLTTITENAVVYGNSTGALQVLAVGGDGQVLMGNDGNPPGWTSTPAGMTIDCGTF